MFKDEKEMYEFLGRDYGFKTMTRIKELINRLKAEEYNRGLKDKDLSNDTEY